MKRLMLVTLAALGLSNSARAQMITFARPTYEGTGCPDGSVEAVLSPDNSALSLLFDQFVVEAGGNANAESRARKSCALKMSAQAPAGFEVGFLQVDYRGFAQIGRDGIASFTAEHLIQTSTRMRPVRTVERFVSGTSKDFLIRHPLTAVKSSCGGQVIMEFSAHILVNAINDTGRTRASADEVSMVGLDSGDLSNQAPIVVRLGLKKCS